MLIFIKLIMYWKILSCFNHDPQTNTGAPKRGLNFNRNIYIWKMFKKSYLLFSNKNASICDITMQTSSDSVDSNLIKPWPLDQYWDPKGVKSSTYELLLRRVMWPIGLLFSLFTSFLPVSQHFPKGVDFIKIHECNLWNLKCLDVLEFHLYCIHFKNFLLLKESWSKGIKCFFFK